MEVIVYSLRVKSAQSIKALMKNFDNKQKKLLTKAFEFDILSELRLTRERSRRNIDN